MGKVTKMEHSGDLWLICDLKTNNPNHSKVSVKGQVKHETFTTLRLATNQQSTKVVETQQKMYT